MAREGSRGTRAFPWGSRSGRGRRHGGGGRDRLSPAVAVAPLIRSVIAADRHLLRRHSPCRRADHSGGGLLLDCPAGAPSGADFVLDPGGLAPGDGRLPVVRWHRRSQAAAPASGALWGGTAALRSGVESLRAGAASDRRLAVAASCRCGPIEPCWC